MSQVVDAQGFTKVLERVVPGMIVAFSGPRVPSGWRICDGIGGTPDLTDRFIVGDTAVGTGTAGGTESADTGLTHSGFALADHANHIATQPSGHSAHATTQPSAHSAHVATQPATHATHESQGVHTHDSHVFADVSNAVAVVVNAWSGPITHSSDGAHTHDAHAAHTGFAVNAHSAHSGFAVDAHSAHAGFAVDAHTAHSVTQASNHLYKLMKLVYIRKI